MNKKKDKQIAFQKFDITKEMEAAFLEIQMARSPYVLSEMVVGPKFTDEQRYAQCTLELSIAYDNLRMAECDAELKQIEIDSIKGINRKSVLERKKKEIELEKLDRARLGAFREAKCLFEMWLKFPKKYTREELNDAQPLEYQRRLEMQALMDKNATGRVSVGNQEGLRQIGKMQFPELDFAREVDKRFISTGNPVEERFLAEGDIKLSIVVPTELKAEKGLACLEGLSLPAGVQVRVENCYGLKVADAYNRLFQTAIDSRSDYILTVEDDTFPEPGALIKLLELIKTHPRTVVGAWYPKKEPSRQGVHIVLKDGIRQQLAADGEKHEVYTVSMGCTLFPTSMLKEIAYPWFVTTANLSQDSFFSQLAREAGYTLLVDTNIKCKHIDRITKEIFE